MARLDWRVRLVGRLLRPLSIARMDAARLAEVQQRGVPHNALTDLLLGGVARGVRLSDGTARGQVGPVPVRTYRPERATDVLPLVVHFHGGGWTLGDLNSGDWLCSNVAASVDAVVVSVDYRLAPGHRWPAAAEDCYAALVDVVARAAELGADSGRVAHKVQKKGRTEQELREVIEWLTGFDQAALTRHLDAETTFEDFFAAASLNPSALRITGTICGVRIEDIDDPLMKKIRYLDKLVDELARGRSMEKVLRA